MKKRFLAVLMALAVSIAFTGCGNKNTENTDSTAESTESVSEESSEEATEDSTASEEEEEFTPDAPIVDETIEDKGIDAFVEIGDYRGIELTKHVTTITDEDVDNEVAAQLSYFPTILEDGTIIENGMTVNVDYKLTKDGEEIDSGVGVDFEMGSPNPVEGFSEGIIGHKKGDTFTYDVVFPEGYQNEKVAGQAATFNITVNEVKKVLDDPTDEWVKENFGYESVDQFREEARAYLENDAQASTDEALRSDAMAAIEEKTTVKQYPQDLVDRYVELQTKSLQDYAASVGAEYNDEFAESLGYTDAMFQQNAVGYAKMEMITTYIMEKEGLTEDSQEFKDEQDKVLALYGFTTIDELEAQGISQENFNMTVRSYLAVDIVIDNAKITEQDDTAQDTAEQEAIEQEAAEETAE